MTSTKTFTFSILASAILVACGGGGGGSHGQAICANFQYQEDAQDAYRNGEKQLDGDNDGKACESLPHRPVDPNDQPGSPGNPSKYKSALFIVDKTKNGDLIVFKPAGPWSSNVTTLQPDGYQISYSGYSGGGGNSGPLVPTIKDGVTEVKSGYLTYRFYETSDSSHLFWMKDDSARITFSGLGVRGTTLQISDISGKYKLLGKRCSSHRTNNWVDETCVPVTSSAFIDSSGRMNICANAEYSATCQGHSSQQLKANGESWNFDEDTMGNLIASKIRGTLALENSKWTYIDGARESLDRYVYFGQLDQVTDSSMKFSEMLSFDASGNLTASIPEAKDWTVKQAEVPGFFKDSVGNTFLASSTGQLITWTQNTATLKEYSKK